MRRNTITFLPERYGGADRLHDTHSIDARDVWEFLYGFHARRAVTDIYVDMVQCSGLDTDEDFVGRWNRIRDFFVRK
jgi:cytochrome b involved in lipid metabolism